MAAHVSARADSAPTAAQLLADRTRDPAITHDTMTPLAERLLIEALLRHTRDALSALPAALTRAGIQVRLVDLDEKAISAALQRLGKMLSDDRRAYRISPGAAPPASRRTSTRASARTTIAPSRFATTGTR